MEGMIKLILLASQLLMLAIFMRALMSWFRPDPNSKAVQLLMKVTDPILVPITRVLPNFSGIDLSPMVAFLILSYLGDYLSSLLPAV